MAPFARTGAGYSPSSALFHPLPAEGNHDLDHRRATGPAAVRYATTATYTVFIGCGFAFASWAARIPPVRDRLDLDPAALGLVLLAIAAGSLLALPLSGPVVSRIGSARTVMANGLTELQLVHHLDPADEVGA